MAGKPPSLAQLVGKTPGQVAKAHGGLPTLAELTGGKSVKLPTLAELTAHPPAGSPKKSGGGGFLHGIAKAVTGSPHWVAQKSELAAHDIKAMPGGLYDLGKTDAHIAYEQVRHPVQSAEHPLLSDPKNPAHNTKAGKHGRELGRGVVKSTETAFAHPLRDPFNTALTVLPIVSGGASAIARAGAVGDAARAGDLAGAAKAALRKPEMSQRLIRVGDKEVPLHASQQPIPRAAQALHDRIVQRAIDKNPEGRIASYGTKRVGGSIDETARYQHRMRDVPSQLLQAAAKRLAPSGSRIPGTGANKFQRVEQAALELTSVNTTPKVAAAYHAAQADSQAARLAELKTKDVLKPAERKTVAELSKSVPLNRGLSKLYEAVDKRGLVKTNEHGDVIVDESVHPKLALADARLADVQGRGDEVLTRYGVRDAAALKSRIDAPGRVRGGAHYVTPAEARAGANDVKAMGRAMEQTTEREGAAAARAAAQRAREFGTSADRAEARAFASGTRRTAAEQEALVESKRVNLAAERASKQRFKNTARAAEGEKAAALLHREQRLAQITYERFQRGEVGPGVVDRAQRRLAAISDRYEQNAGAVATMRTATRAGNDAAKAQETHIAALRDAEQAATKAHEAATAEAAALRGKSTGAAYRADYLKKLGALKTEKVRATTERTVAEELARADKLLGGNSARPGRGFVSYATSEPKAPKSSASASSSTVVGEAKAPVTSHAFTGQGIEHGHVPNNITGQAARHYHQIIRFVNTTEHRNLAIQAGADTRRTSRDVLVKIPGAEHAKIPDVVNEILGKKTVTADDLEGLNAALHAYKEDIVPGLRDRFATDRHQGIGTPAPDGYRWVDRNVLGDLGRPAVGPRGKVARTADSINSAVTAATVYFKLGHIATRVVTNAVTNIIQGSAGPRQIAKSVNLWHALSHEDKLRALAAAGQHGFEAMPHEGQTLAGRAATRGANWWAKHADAPFRFNSIAYEARKAGFDTPDKFRYMLSKMEDGGEGLNAAQHAKIDWVAKRANRAQIAYDRMSDAERRYVARALWFYPWVKGASMFLGHTIAEHPYKTGALAIAGQQGKSVQQNALGDLPSYEGGLIPLSGGSTPTVTDFSTFSPFSTPADLMNAAARPAELSGLLNPALTAGTNLIFGLNQYGQKSKSPLKDALASLASPTPEAQILTAYLGRNQDQSNRMFPKSKALAGTKDPLVRALLGPWVPRKLNPNAAHSSAARERSGR